MFFDSPIKKLLILVIPLVKNEPIRFPLTLPAVRHITFLIRVKPELNKPFTFGTTP